MAYVDPNFKSKKALKEAVAKGLPVSVFSPGPYPAPRTARPRSKGRTSPSRIAGTRASRCATAWWKKCSRKKCTGRAESA